MHRLLGACLLGCTVGSAMAQAPRAAELPPQSGPASVVLDAVRFEGRTRLSEAELQLVAAPFLGRPLRPLDLEELRQRLSRAYVERGWVSSGAVLGPQALQGGTLTVRIVEGTVTRVRQQGLQGLDEAYLASRLVRPAEPLHLPTLQERFQLQLADPLFERLNARLLPGDAPGQSVLDLDVTRARPWQLSLFAHNHVAPAVGSTAAGVEGSLRNLLGWGDRLGGSVQASGGTLGYDLAWAAPLAARSTTATLRLARARSSVVEEPLAGLDIDSVVATREATLAHTLVDEARLRSSIGLTHALRRSRTRLGGEAFSFVPGEATGTTRVESWRLQGDLTWRIDRHVLALQAAALHGRNNLVAADAGLPRQPPPRYRLWQLQGQASVALDDAGLQLALRALMQRSPDALVPLEQLAVGGRASVRGWRENQLVRDNGQMLSLELRWPAWRDDGARASLVLVPFVDAGSAWNHAEPRRRLASAGLGALAAWGDLELELFVARRLERRDPDTRGDLQDHGIHVLVRWRPTL